MIGAEYAEYRCSACKKDVKSVVLQCKKCVKCFFQPGCANKHRIVNKDSEVVRCEGPFLEISVESEKTEMRKTPVTGNGRERLGSTGSIGSTATTSGSNKQSSMDTKIDWLVKTVKEMKDEVACKSEIMMVIKQIIREELVAFKRELEEIKQNMEETMR